MYSSRTTLILFIILSIGTILQLIGLFTPRWNMQSDKVNHVSIYQGLWFYTFCVEQDKCKTRSYYDDYKDHHSPIQTFQYARVVGSQVIALLSFIFCLVSNVLACLIYRDHDNKQRFCMLVSCLLLVSGSLIWTKIGSRSAANAAMAAIVDVKFPYSVFLSALGSTAAIVLGLVNFVALWRDNFGRRESFLLNTHNTD